MSFYWIKTHSLIKKLFSRYIWDFPNTEKKVCTSHSMTDLLKSYRMGFGTTRTTQRQSYFFCIGKNIEAYPLFWKLIEKHLIGNHTFDHLNGWKTTKEDYIKYFTVKIRLKITIGINSLDSKLFDLHMEK
jgi:hypothetical protein